MCSPTCPRCPQRRNCFKNKSFDVVLGVIVGGVICLGYVMYEVISRAQVAGDGALPSGNGSSGRYSNGGPYTWDVGGAFVPQKVVIRKPLYIGILTMDRYLNSRAATCNRTWATHPGISKLDFFARLGRHRHGTGVVNLTGIEGDDSFHRQESFEMLKYVCRHHIEEYDWFVRAVDDAYIKVDQLLGLLSTLDKGKMFYLGHPSLGAEDYDVRAADGNYYCLGGPGIVLSRTALKGLCPHLESCKRKFHDASADAELGRCVRSVLGIECTRSSKFRERFYHSYERNTFKLADEFLRQDGALSLHPLKTAWLMGAVHKRVDNGALMGLSQRLSWLRGRATTLTRNVLTENTSSHSWTRVDQLIPSPLTILTGTKLELSQGACAPIRTMTPSSEAELLKTFISAKTSFLFGNGLTCPEFVNGRVLRAPGVATNYTLNLVCTDLLRPNVTVLANAGITIPLADYKVDKERHRTVHTKLLVFLHAYYGDPKLMEFLIMWKNLMRHKTRSDTQLVLFLIYDAHRRRHSAADMDITIPDLDRWKRERKLNLETYVFNSSVSAQKMHQMALGNLGNRFQDAVVLLVRPGFTFDATFLQKCRFLVRPGKRIYRPFAEQTVIFKHETFSMETDTAVHGVFWNNEFSPVCIHQSDLARPAKKRTKSGRPKQLKIIRSFDLNLRLDDI